MLGYKAPEILRNEAYLMYAAMTKDEGNAADECFSAACQGVHRLVLGGGSDVSVYGKIGQERFDLGFGGKEMLTGPHPVETNKPYNPVHVGTLGVNGVMVQTEYLPDLIEEFWLLTFCRVRHIKVHNDSLRSLIMSIGQNCPKTRLLSHYQGKIAR
jgi:hypothetical protein